MARYRYRKKVRTDDIGSVNRLFSYTVLFILMMSLIGISSLTKNYIGSVLISQLGLVVPLSMYCLLNTGRIKEVLGIGKINIVSAFASLGLGLAILPFISLVNNLSAQVVKNVTSERAAQAAEKNPFILMYLAVAIIPAIVEELMFRGTIFNAYRKNSLIKGAICAAVLFGLLHGNLNQFAYAMVAGFLFAMTDYAGGSVFYSIIAHCTINSVTIIGLYNPKIVDKLQGIIYFTDKYNSSLEVLKVTCLPAIIGLVLSAIMYLIIRTKSKNYTDKLLAIERVNNTEKVYKNLKIIDASLMVGVIIMVVNMIANEFV